MEAGTHSPFHAVVRLRDEDNDRDGANTILLRVLADLALVECKLNKITLRDVSQLLGYSRVANPMISVILSTRDIPDRARR